MGYKNRICVSVAEKSFEEVMAALEQCDFAEIRLDLCDISLDEIRTVFSLPKTFVATCREGKYSDEERIERLSAAIRSGATYVDIEMDDSDDFRQRLTIVAAEYSCKIIISHHDFCCTPDYDGLDELIENCHQKGAYIVKLVTTALVPADCARVLSLYNKYTNLIAFAMSDVGKITRLSCLYLGAPFTYASLGSGKAVASGQLSRTVLEETMKLLGE